MSRCALAVLVLVMGLVACTPVPLSPETKGSDAWSEDPAVVDDDYLPGLAEIRIPSHGSSLNGLVYIAGGPGPHPTIVLLHGFPGNEKNLDLAQAVRRIGFNVLFFHYRGSWGSEGDFGFGHTVEDVGAALTFLRSDAARKRYRVDASRLALVGHSMGGFAALKAASLDPDIRCVTAIAPWDLSVMAEILDGAPGSFAGSVDTMGPLRGMSGAAAVAEILERRDDFDLVKLAPALSGKSALLIGARRDTVLPPERHFQPLATAYEATPGLRFTAVMLDGDHAFSWTRNALMQTVTRWLDETCR